MKSPIPAAALDKHIAFLGATGSGKTSAAKSGIVEPSLDGGERVLVIDPTGAWYGLRVRADGKTKGYPIYIFGGDHGDYPLRAKDAGVLAEAFGTSSDSAIFDTSLMTVAERTSFFTEFAEAIRRKNKGPMKLIIDEAHLFMPQAGARSGGAMPAMLHAGNNLVSLGRSKGLRITLISQRPAKLHKDALTQVQSMVAMRLMAPQDRNAVSDWIADQADAAKGKEIVASLPSLKPGEAWVWVPEADVLNRIKFTLPRTFDSSSAPSMRDGAGPELQPLNMDALKGRLGKVETERKANDPKALQARIRELETAAKSTIPANAVKDAERIGYERGIAEGEARADVALAVVHDKLAAIVDGLVDARTKTVAAPKAMRPILTPPAIIKQPRAIVAASPPVATGEFTGPQMKIIRSLSMWRTLGHTEPSREMVAAACGYSPNSGGFNNLLGSLSTMQAIGKPQAGRVSLMIEPEPMTSDDGKNMMLGKLSNPQRKLIDALTGQSAMSRDDLATATAYSANSGGFNNLIGSLSTLGIIVKPGPGQVQLSDWAQELLT